MMTLRDLRTVFDNETTFYLCRKFHSDEEDKEYIEQIKIGNYLWGHDEIANMVVGMDTVKAARYQVHIYVSMPSIVWKAWKEYAECVEIVCNTMANEEV